MNKTYRLIWSRTKEKLIAVSEKVAAGWSRRPLVVSAVALAVVLAAGGPAQAVDTSTLPTGGHVVAGQAHIAQSGNSLTVNQSTDRMIAAWDTFNIGQNASVAFQQPGASSVALNRIQDQNPSQIFGSLTSNGQIFLLNPAGVYFGATARVDVGGVVASSLDLSNENFLSGKYDFENTGTAGSIINQGNIRSSGGYVAFISPKITNEGAISTPGGTTAMAAGDKVSLDFTGDRLVTFTVDQGAVDALIENKGLVQADGGAVIMTAKAADNLTQAVVNNEGVIEARTLESKSGRILLLSDMESGETVVDGKLDASAPDGGDGGFIETSAAKVTVQEGAEITTLAQQGKTGEWLIDPQDYTIAASGGDITGSQLSTALDSASVTISSTTGVTEGNGDIFVNDSITWSANALTLIADRNIEINRELFGSGTASLALEYGQGAVASGNTASYSVNAPVNLPAGENFSTKLGSDGTVKNFTVITTLGNAGSITAADLQGMSGNLSGNYALGGNIDASETSGWNSGAGFVPIGDNSNNFTGTFDGLGHTISDLTINRPDTDYVGLFGYTDNAAVSNVGITGGSIEGRNYVGGLVGCNDSGSITNSYATGAIAGTYYVGGLMGWNKNNSSITNSYATGAATAADYVGGLVGYNDSNSTVTNSYATGMVKGASRVGGLVGYNFNSNIIDSYATGAVIGSSLVGGLVGKNESSTVTNSFYDQDTTGQNDTGKGTPLSTSDMMTQAKFTDWDFTNTWYMTEGNTRPFLRMEYSTTITNAHQLQLMQLDLDADYTLASNIDMGELTQTSGLWNTSTGFVPVGNNYNGTSTRFSGTFDGLGHTISDLTINRPDTEYVGLFGYTDNAAVSNVGIIDGFIEGDKRVGALAGLNSNSIITNSYATGAVTGSSYHVGGLVGHNYDSVITDSYATGTVSGDSAVGGLVGYNSDNSVITDNYATGAVTGYSYRVGGLVGQQDYSSSITRSCATGAVTGDDSIGGLVGSSKNSSITDSYATGAVTADTTTYVGGLVGYNYDTDIIDSYATGIVLCDGSLVGGLAGYNNGTVTNSFYDSQTTGQNDTGKGTPLTTTEMMTQANFTGWDFVGVWEIEEGISYPYHQWRYPAGVQVVSGSATDTPDVPNPTAVDLYVNADLVSTANTGANGFYYLLMEPGSIDSGDFVLFHNADNTAYALAKSAGGHLTGFDSSTDTLTLHQDHADTPGNALLSSAKTALGGAAPFTDSSGSITLDAGISFAAADPFVLNNSISTSSGAGITFNDTLTISADTSLTTGADSAGSILCNGAVNSDAGQTRNLTLTAGTGDVAFSGSVGATDALNNLTINSAGDVTAENAANNFSGSVAITATGNVSISDANDLTLGASTIGGNYTAEAQGGDLTIAGDISKTSGADATATFKATGDIIQNSTVSIDSSSNKLNTIFWADSDASTGGYIRLGADAPITTNGGHLWLGGGSGSTPWNGLTVGDGYAEGTAALPSGIYIDGGAIATSGGDIAMYGKSAASGEYSLLPNGQPAASGIYSNSDAGNQYSIDSGTGTIYLEGLGVNAVNSAVDRTWYGEALYLNGGTLTSSATGGDAITLIGDSSGATSDRAGGLIIIGWDAARKNTIQATGGGDIVLDGTAGSGGTSEFNKGVRLYDYTDIITTNGGNISITAETGDDQASQALILEGTNGQINSSGTLTINAGSNKGSLFQGKLIATGTTAIANTGQDITAQNADNDFKSTVAISGKNVSLRDAGALDLGTSNIGGDLTLQTDGELTQSGALTVAGTTSITAGSGSSIALSNAGNDFTGEVSVISGDDVSLKDAGSLTLGGMTLAGALTAEALGGNLTIDSILAWTSTDQYRLAASDTVVVNAVIENTNAAAGGVFFSAGNTTDKVVFNGNGKVLIHNVEQLQWMNTALAGTYELGGDIDASETSGWNSGDGFVPIGDVSTKFTGTFDGLGHTISDLTINWPDTEYVGLFGYTDNAAVSNVGITGVSIEGESNVGGLVGWNYRSSVTNSHATGTVAGSSYQVGGLVGVNESSTIDNSYTTTTVSGNGDSVGGLVGVNNTSGDIKNSYATGAVESTSYVGGLVGTNWGSTVENSYATGAVSGTGQSVGGLVGKNESSSTITNSYAIGEVTGYSYEGGLVGKNESSTVTNSFYDQDTTGQNDTGKGTPLSTSDMQTLTTFNSSWDIDDAGGTANTWRLYEGDSYPLLRGFMTDATITSVADGSKIYDGVAYSGGNGYVVVGASADRIFYGGTAQGAKNAGDYVLTIYSDQQGYDLSGTRTANLTIETLPLTASYTGINKVYDAMTTAAVTGSSADIIVGDTVNFSQAADFADKNVGTSKLVNVADISISGTDAANYSLQNVTATTQADITAKAITISGITAADKVYDATTNAAVDATNASGWIAGDVFNVTATGTFGNKDVGTDKTVTLTSSYDGADVANYTITDQATTQADITAKAITIAGITAADKVYDATTNAAVDATNASGWIAGDVFNVTATGTFGNKDVGTDKIVTLSSSYDGADASNYTITDQANATADITAKAITIAGITAADKVYDATTNAAVDATNASGWIAGDIFNVTATGGTFGNKDVGTDKIVTLSSSYDGADVANYTITDQATTQADITAKAITISGITAADKVYDAATNAAVDATNASGWIAGDVFNVTATGTFGNKDVGTDKIVTLASSYDGADVANYTITDQATTQADITAKAITISGITAADKVYDATTNAAVDATNASGWIAGDVFNVSATGTFDTKNVGSDKTVTLTSSYDGADASNYTITDQATTQADITAKAITISGITAADKVYDATTNAAVDATNASGWIADDAISVSAAGTFDTKNVGSDKTVTLTSSYSGADVGNYTITDQTVTTASIMPAPLMVTADDKSKTYGQTISFAGNEFSSSGLQNSETIGSVALSSDGSAATANVSGSPYAITASGATGGTFDAGNYNITYNDGSLTVNPAALTVTANDDSRTYDGAAYNGGNGVSYDGFVNGESESVLSGTLAYGGDSQGAVRAGTYSINPRGLTSGNYTISFVDGVLTITEKTTPSGPPTIIVDSVETALVGSWDGGVNGTVEGMGNSSRRTQQTSRMGPGSGSGNTAPPPVFDVSPMAGPGGSAVISTATFSTPVTVTTAGQTTTITIPGRESSGSMVETGTLPAFARIGTASSAPFGNFIIHESDTSLSLTRTAGQGTAPPMSPEMPSGESASFTLTLESGVTIQMGVTVTPDGMLVVSAAGAAGDIDVGQAILMSAQVARQSLGIEVSDLTSILLVIR